jgi:hypothetical protein
MHVRRIRFRVVHTPTRRIVIVGATQKQVDELNKLVGEEAVEYTYDAS